MDEKRKVRIGFVGVGGMGQCAHLKHYASLPDCEVVALAEVRPELAKRVAKKYDVPHVYANAGEMVASEKLDGLVAPQQFTRHGIVLGELYKFGLPVLSEKPLAASIEVGEQLLQALKAGGSWHMVGYHKRSDPATMYAKAEIERLRQTGELGALRYVRILMPAGDWVANGFFDLLRSDEPMPPLTADPVATDMDAASYKKYVDFVNYYIHQVNMLRHLLGEPYHVTFADKAGMLLVAESASGVTGTIEMSPYQTSVAWQESMLVAFEHGYVKVELPAPLTLNRPGRVEVLRDPGNGVTPTETVPHLPWVGAMRQQAMNYVAAIRGEIKPLCQAAEALEDLKVAREYLKLWKGV
jgi:predicted dehydrogenase